MALNGSIITVTKKEQLNRSIFYPLPLVCNILGLAGKMLFPTQATL